MHATNMSRLNADASQKQAAAAIAAPWFNYSLRRASIGLTNVARLAGSQQAKNATVPKRIVTAAKVNGSLGLTP
jgi:hypothetical protein